MESESVSEMDKAEPDMKTGNVKPTGKILIIDHSENRLSSLGYLLLSNGCDVVTATDPGHALEIIDNTFDLVLCELTIPRIPGNKIVEHIRGNPVLFNVPIMVVSMKKLDNSEISSIFDLGIDDFMVQPVMEQELLSRIRLHIRMRRLVEEYARLNAGLVKELDRNSRIHDAMVQYATIIEDELAEKIKHLVAKDKTKLAMRVIAKLKSELAHEREDQAALIEENRRYREELDKISKIHSVVILHDSAIEEEMTTRIDEESHKASHDHLTQIYNRIKFYEALYSEIEKFRSNHHSLSVIMFDIDHFKKVNDTYGHDAGDTVLLNITKTVTSSLTGNEIFARWGGEEFMILLASKNVAEAVTVAEMLRKKIEQESYEVIGNVTCSFGVTQFESADDASSVLKRVDNALYKAKRNGRNRVESVGI
jgi:two-component system, cell cycle response regulator